MSSSYSIEIIYLSHAKTEHTLFVPLWPLVWKGLWIESTKSILPLFVLFLLATVLSVLLWFTAFN
jgi:hypothetical protein